MKNKLFKNEVLENRQLLAACDTYSSTKILSIDISNTFCATAADLPIAIADDILLSVDSATVTFKPSIDTTLPGCAGLTGASANLPLHCVKTSGFNVESVLKLKIEDTTAATSTTATCTHSGSVLFPATAATTGYFTSGAVVGTGALAVFAETYDVVSKDVKTLWTAGAATAATAAGTAKSLKFPAAAHLVVRLTQCNTGEVLGEVITATAVPATAIDAALTAQTLTLAAQPNADGTGTAIAGVAPTVIFDASGFAAFVANTAAFGNGFDASENPTFGLLSAAKQAEQLKKINDCAFFGIGCDGVILA